MIEESYLATTDDEHVLVPYLPGENQTATTLNLWVLVLVSGYSHDGC